MKNAAIHTYVWPLPSAIARMECEPAPTGLYTARLTCAEGTDADLGALPKLLHKYGFSSAYADVCQGQNVLVVPHVKDPARLANALSATHYTSGAAHHEATATRKQKKHRDTLKLSGRTGLIGHATLMASGILQHEWGRVLEGPMGGSTAAILARYGNGKSDIDFDTMLGQMHHYFACEGVELPSFDTPKHKKTILGAIDKALATYPIPIAHAIGSIGSLGVMHAGWQRFSETRGTRAQSGLGLLLAGTSSLLGNLVVLFVPEKKKTKKEQQKDKLQSWKEWGKSLPTTWAHLLKHPTEIPGAFWNFLCESPLRFNGGLNFIDNFLYFIAAFGERKTMHSWAKNNPPKIARLQGELKTLLSSPTTVKNAKRITELEKEIPAFVKQMELAQSWRGKMVPYLTLVTALSFGCATFLSAISSKNRDGQYSDDKAYERLYALVTKMVIAMPPEKREDMLTRIACYLSSQEEIKDGEITAKKLTEEVHKRITTLEQSPWLPKQGSHVANIQQETHGTTPAL